MAFCYVQNPTGGVFAGDRLDRRLTAEPGARVHLTTQSATKLYRMEGGRAHQALLPGAAGAYARTVPDALIPQAGSRFLQRLRSSSSRGAVARRRDRRARTGAHGERFVYELLELRIEVRPLATAVCRAAELRAGPALAGEPGAAGPERLRRLAAGGRSGTRRRAARGRYRPLAGRADRVRARQGRSIRRRRVRAHPRGSAPASVARCAWRGRPRAGSCSGSRCLGSASDAAGCGRILGDRDDARFAAGGSSAYGWTRPRRRSASCGAPPTPAPMWRSICLAARSWPTAPCWPMTVSASSWCGGARAGAAVSFSPELDPPACSTRRRGSATRSGTSTSPSRSTATRCASRSPPAASLHARRSPGSSSPASTPSSPRVSLARRSPLPIGHAH